MKLIDYTYKTTRFFLITAMAIMAIVIIIQVLSRNIIGYSFTWAEELARFLLVWVTFLGASMALHNKVLPAFDMLERKLKTKGSSILQVVIYALILIFLIFTLIYGIQIMVKPTILQQTSPGLGIPMAFPYAAVPFGSLIMIIYCIAHIIDKFKKGS